MRKAMGARKFAYSETIERTALSRENSPRPLRSESFRLICQNFVTT